jgi:hypothetical protein
LATDGETAVQVQGTSLPNKPEEGKVRLPRWPAIDVAQAKSISGQLKVLLSGKGAADQTNIGNDGLVPPTYLQTIFPRVVAMYQHLVKSEPATSDEAPLFLYFWKEVLRILKSQRTLCRSTYDVLGRLEDRLMDLVEETQAGGSHEVLPEEETPVVGLGDLTEEVAYI